VAVERCPICKKTAKARTENPTFPFCSPRCRSVDLGKWLNEEYRVHLDDEPDEDDAVAPDDGSPSKPDMRH